MPDGDYVVDGRDQSPIPGSKKLISRLSVSLLRRNLRMGSGLGLFTLQDISSIMRALQRLWSR